MTEANDLEFDETLVPSATAKESGFIRVLIEERQSIKSVGGYWLYILSTAKPAQAFESDAFNVRAFF